MASAERNRAAGVARLVALYGLVGVIVWLARPTGLSLAVGAPLIALGECVRCWSAGHLVKTDELITGGPYRHTRNPLYLGRLLIFTGLAVAAGPVGWLVLAPGWGVFFIYYLPRKERVEPARLVERHGDAYRRYRDAVPALWPSWSGWPGADASRRWSWARLRRNREHWMVAGLLALFAALAWKSLGS